MKRSIATLVPVFNTNRMVEEYTERCYIPSHRRHAKLLSDHLKNAIDLAAWRAKLQAAWSQVRIDGIEMPPADLLKVGGELPITARVNLGTLLPEDVEVQVCYGLLDNRGEIAHPKSLPLVPSRHQDSLVHFQGTVPCQASGQFGYTVRVLPKHANLGNAFEPGLVAWG
jgi:starch phosphorylase